MNYVNKLLAVFQRLHRAKRFAGTQIDWRCWSASSNTTVAPSRSRS
jgi:hypothetical protein